ncbi:MAG: class F sortase [Ornithinibacter sp.]
MTSSTRRRAWSAVTVMALVTSVAALVALAAEFVGRPESSAGTTLSDARSTASAPPSAATPTPSPTPSGPVPSRSLAPVGTRDGSLDALETTGASAPARLVIRDLGVDATITGVGVQEDGAMVIPAAPTSVGWYRYGSAPGDPEGNTVIAGHVATREDGPGALAPLRGAMPGMRVTVTTADGTKRRYEVVGRELVVKKALPVDEIFARDGKPLLVLITCGGEYLPELRSHRDNVVVTAVPLPAG